MNGNEIDLILSNNEHTKDLYDGVYAVDNLMKLTFKPRLLICNTDVSTSSGKHWVLMLFKSDIVEFFDPLGKDPNEYHTDFVKYMSQYGTHCKYMVGNIQEINSSLCGHYCVLYSIYRCMSVSMIDVLYRLNMLNVLNVVKLLSEDNNHFLL